MKEEYIPPEEFEEDDESDQESDEVSQESPLSSGEIFVPKEEVESILKKSASQTRQERMETFKEKYVYQLTGLAHAQTDRGEFLTDY